MKKILFIFGTRPEAIKLAPLIRRLREESDRYAVVVCVTGQHRQMLDGVLQFFEIVPDHDLDVMTPNQTLHQITARIVTGLADVLRQERPDIVIVQGDTTTAFVGALSAFYEQIPVAHVEAGLRSGNRYSPFPEEVNRIMVGHLASLHFAPTDKARAFLAGDGITQGVYVTGNTVIDALFQCLEKLKGPGEQECATAYSFLDPARRLILVTGHRRESFGGPFESICHALADIIQTYPDVEILYPVHLNPHVRTPVGKILSGQPRIHLIEPVPYHHLVWLLRRCHLVLTDSGGIQEEAPSLGKPVLVMREVTERTEGIEAGTARLVGVNREEIVRSTSELLDNDRLYDAMAKAVNPYGDGTTSHQITGILHHYWPG